MENDRKRKRAGSDDVHSGGSRRRKKEKEREVAPESPAPTDEEVDEFYAILRRMHVAVKYFKKSNGNHGQRKLTERLATPLESQAASPEKEEEDEDDEDIKLNEKSVNGVADNAALDLNTVPQYETD